MKQMGLIGKVLLIVTHRDEMMITRLLRFHQLCGAFQRVVLQPATSLFWFSLDPVSSRTEKNLAFHEQPFQKYCNLEFSILQNQMANKKRGMNKLNNNK